MLEMLLMVLFMAAAGIASVTLTFWLATREDPPEVKAAHELEREPAPHPRFFVQRAPELAVQPPRVPIEALLLQIERHIRLEQAAAQSFLDCPTAQSLHRPTASPLVQ